MPQLNTDKNFEWAVIGAGPAGIAAVGQLLENGIAAKDILWVDPEFSVGDFGTKWLNVPSNTRVKLFQMFLRSCKAFEYDQCEHDFALNHLNPMDNCLLRYMAEPLQWV